MHQKIKRNFYWLVMYGLGKGGYESDIQVKTKGKKGKWGVSQQVKRGLEQRNKVENNKIKITRTYKNESAP